MQLPTALRPLRHRSFALLLGAGTISNTGSWMQTIAIASLVKATTGKDTLVALAAFANFLPLGILSPVGGALADRLNRQRFLIITNTFEAAIAACLSIIVFTGHVSTEALTGLVFLEGCSAALRIPFQQSLLPDLVPREDLLGGIALGSMQYNAGRVIGPAIAAIVIASFGFGAAFAVNAVSFFAVVGAQSVLRLPRPTGGGELGIWARIVEGARGARADPGCRTALSLMAVTAFLISPFIALIAGRAGALVGSNKADIARTTGYLTTAQGVGAVIGALVVPTLAERIGRRRVLVSCLFLSPIFVTAYGFAPNTVAAVAAMTLLGASYMGLLSGLQAVIQLRAPAEMRGRIVSLFLVALGVLYPVGALWQGAIGDAVGLRWATLTGAVILLVILGILTIVRPRALDALDADGHIDSPAILAAPEDPATIEATAAGS